MDDLKAAIVEAKEIFEGIARLAVPGALSSKFQLNTIADTATIAAEKMAAAIAKAESTP